MKNKGVSKKAQDLRYANNKDKINRNRYQGKTKRKYLARRYPFSAPYKKSLPGSQIDHDWDQLNSRQKFNMFEVLVSGSLVPTGTNPLSLEYKRMKRRLFQGL